MKYFFIDAEVNGLYGSSFAIAFTIHDVATLLLMAGEEPDSIDSFLKKKGVVVEFEGTPHHPMYDAVAAAQVWELYHG